MNWIIPPENSLKYIFKLKICIFKITDFLLPPTSPINIKLSCEVLGRKHPSPMVQPILPTDVNERRDLWPKIFKWNYYVIRIFTKNLCPTPRANILFWPAIEGKMIVCCWGPPEGSRNMPDSRHISSETISRRSSRGIGRRSGENILRSTNGQRTEDTGKEWIKNERLINDHFCI